MGVVHWTSYVTAIFAPIIAALAVFIAFRQWKTAENKLKLDLFDRRMMIIQAARDLIGCVATNASTSHQDKVSYLKGIQSAQWFFNEEICNYLKVTLWDKIVELEESRAYASRDNPDEKERVKHIRLEADVLKWIVAQNEKIDEMCGEYMKLSS